MGGLVAVGVNCGRENSLDGGMPGRTTSSRQSSDVLVLVMLHLVTLSTKITKKKGIHIYEEISPHLSFARR